MMPSKQALFLYFQMAQHSAGMPKAWNLFPCNHVLHHHHACDIFLGILTAPKHLVVTAQTHLAIQKLNRQC